MFNMLIKKYLTYLYKTYMSERRFAQEQLFLPAPGARLLDCGCREGDGTLRASRGIQTNDLIGIDYNSHVLAIAKNRGITSIQADLNRSIPLRSNSIDIILASDVLEHLTDPFIFTGEMFIALKPGGSLILDTPNLASWHNIFALLIGTQPFSGPNITTMTDADIPLVREMHRVDHQLPEEGITEVIHEQEVNRHIVVIAYQSLLRLIRRQGFILEMVKGFGYYPLPPLLGRIFQRLDPRHAHHILLKAVKPSRNL